MTKGQLAEALNGKDYRTDIADDLLKIAERKGLIIVYGVSDDLVEFEGAINDEAGLYEGGEILVDSEGILPDRDQLDDDDELEKWLSRKKKSKSIEALWFAAENEPAWTFKTKIPHVTFNVMEDGEIQCRGIVFELKDLN